MVVGVGVGAEVIEAARAIRNSGFILDFSGGIGNN